MRLRAPVQRSLTALEMETIISSLRFLSNDESIGDHAGYYRAWVGRLAENLKSFVPTYDDSLTLTLERGINGDAGSPR